MWISDNNKELKDVFFFDGINGEELISSFPDTISEAYVNHKSQLVLKIRKESNSRYSKWDTTIYVNPWNYIVFDINDKVDIMSRIFFIENYREEK